MQIERFNHSFFHMYSISWHFTDCQPEYSGNNPAIITGSQIKINIRDRKATQMPL